MAMRGFYNEIKGVKVKELPAHLKPFLTIDFVKKTVERSLEKYRVKYIETSSIQPLYHVCFGGMLLSYFLALPEEHRHLAHKQQQLLQQQQQEQQQQHSSH